jgi:hypothetical protein
VQPTSEEGIMSFKQFTSSRLGRVVALASVAAALAIAITGQALAVASPYPPDLIERWVASHKAQVLGPGDRMRQINKPATSYYRPEGPGIAQAYQRLHNRPAVSFFTPEALAQMYACDSGTTQYVSDVVAHCEYLSPSSSWSGDAP